MCQSFIPLTQVHLINALVDGGWLEQLVKLYGEKGLECITSRCCVLTLYMQVKNCDPRFGRRTDSRSSPRFQSITAPSSTRLMQYCLSSMQVSPATKKRNDASRFGCPTSPRCFIKGCGNPIAMQNSCTLLTQGRLHCFRYSLHKHRKHPRQAGHSRRPVPIGL